MPTPPDSMGRSVKRVEGAEKVTGRARYTADASCPDSRTRYWYRRRSPTAGSPADPS